MQIDKGTPFKVNDTLGRAYKQWFQTPTLFDGSHTIAVDCSIGTQVDFAIVDVGNQTRLAGRDIIVDNESPSISYFGHWNRSTSRFNDTSVNLRSPYGNSTHRSSTPGDIFTFRFTGALVDFPRIFFPVATVLNFVAGTSVSVYGIFSWFNIGTLGATFTIDGAIVPQTYNVTSPDLATGFGEVTNFVYYSRDLLSAGDHTLIVNITSANNQTFILDYITYTPSFEMLSMNNTTTTFTSITSSPSPGNPSLPTSGTPQPAAIVGGVIGVLTLGILVAILGRWLFLRRRKSKQTETFPIPCTVRSRIIVYYSITYCPSDFRCKQPTHTKS